MKLINICKTFVSSNGVKTELFKNLNMEFKDNEITCVMGASGSGKTTLLNILAGTVIPDSGRIEINSNRISYLFQEPRLLGWKSILDNVALVSDKEKAKKYLDLVGLENLYDKYPDELSGGQRQRVAIARALAFDAPIVLLDEPFQNLDEAIRLELTDKMVTFCKETKKTVVWVTHDSIEAKKISDTILYL